MEYSGSQNVSSKHTLYEYDFKTKLSNPFTDL